MLAALTQRSSPLLRNERGFLEIWLWWCGSRRATGKLCRLLQIDHYPLFRWGSTRSTKRLCPGGGGGSLFQAHPLPAPHRGSRNVRTSSTVVEPSSAVIRWVSEQRDIQLWILAQLGVGVSERESVCPVSRYPTTYPILRLSARFLRDGVRGV